LSLPLLSFPESLKVIDDRPDFLVLKLLFKSGHPTLEVGDVQRGPAVLNDAEKQAIAVVPGVAGSVMRWSRVAAIRAFDLPVRLTLSPDPVASGAVLLVYRTSQIRLGHAIGVSIAASCSGEK
jgi:hypothetical protein